MTSVVIASTPSGCVTGCCLTCGDAVARNRSSGCDVGRSTTLASVSRVRRVRAALDPDALAHGDHAAGADREALAVLLQVDPDHFAGPDHDVLVQDGVPDHCAA